MGLSRSLYSLLVLSLGMSLSWAALAQPYTQAAVVIPDLPSGQTVGTTITWFVSSDIPEPRLFRFGVIPPGETAQIIYDYRSVSAFEWTPIEDGTYTIFSTVTNTDTQESSTALASFTVLPALPAAFFSSVVNATNHPLVALYSAAACAPGLSMRVSFFDLGNGTSLTTTNLKPCRSGRSMNFYLAGMRAETPHLVRHELINSLGSHVEFGPLRVHSTGAAELAFPARTVLRPAGPQDSLLDKVILFGALGAVDENIEVPFATDLDGELIWYLNGNTGPGSVQLAKPVLGGTILTLVNIGEVEHQILRETDLAGNVVRETNVLAVNNQLSAMGHDPINDIHHEARRLPDGRTAVLATIERFVTDLQGPGEVDTLGDYVIVLDENFQVDWVWDGMEKMDLSRRAILDEKCSNGDDGCPPVILAEVANDWMHSNGIEYSPQDGNLLISVRHHDWIIKIDYRDGVGRGDILWRLGPGGNFTLLEWDQVWPWQGHQHDAQLLGPNTLVVFDNGNTRCDLYALCESRGQVYEFNEIEKTARLLVDARLGNYSFALGSAQRLMNGNFFFNSGLQTQEPPPFATVHEAKPNGELGFEMRLDTLLYRSYRLPSLYAEPHLLLLPAPREPSLSAFLRGNR